MKLNSIWVVHDPTSDSELIDILYEAKGANELASLAIGTGLSQWKHENTTLYSEEGEAKKDAEARMKKQKKEAMTDPLASRVAARFADELQAAKPAALDPSKAVEGNAVAYYDIDGDPESVSLHKGDKPVEIVMNIIHKRLKDMNGKAQPGPQPGEIVTHFTGFDGKPATFTTKVKVQARK